MIDHDLYRNLEKEVIEDRIRKTTFGNLNLYKYSENTANKRLWNATNRKARGIIIHDKTHKIVARSFEKFFNLNECDETKLEVLPKSPFLISEKLDGSCATSYLGEDGKIACATPGAFESDQAKWSTNWLRNHLESIGQLGQFEILNDGLTFIFEAIYPENLNVVTYGQRTELVLLSVISHAGHEIHPVIVDDYANWFHFTRPRTFQFDLSLMPKFPPNEEGYVAYWPTENFRVKIKSPEYVQLHRLKNLFTAKGFCEALSEGRYKELFEILPKHLQVVADDIVGALRTKFFDIKTKYETIYDSVKNLGSRKEQAIEIQKHDKELWHLVFARLDHDDEAYMTRQIWRYIYKTLPTKDTTNVDV